MNDQIFQLLIGLVCTLGLINAFFIQKLIKKIDESSESVRDFRRDMAHLTEKVQQIADIAMRLAILEKEMAVLTYVIDKFSNVENKTP